MNVDLLSMIPDDNGIGDFFEYEAPVANGEL